MEGWLNNGVGELIRQASLQLIQLLMEEEVRQLVGDRSQPAPGVWRTGGAERARACVVMGQKVPVQRTRGAFHRRP